MFDERRSGTGIRDIRVEIDTGSGFSQLGSTLNVLDDDKWRSQTFNMTGQTGLDSASVRIFGLNAESSAGSWKLDNVQINGSVTTAVPEPSSFLLLGMIAFAGLSRSMLRQRIHAEQHD